MLDNLMLYHEGWGVGRIKHSLTYSGGLSRSDVWTYAPARRYGFTSSSPYTRPDVVAVAKGIPFAALTRYDVPALYALKGESVRTPARSCRSCTRHRSRSAAGRCAATRGRCCRRRQG